MKQVRPFTALVLPPAVLAVVFAGLFFCCLPERRGLWDILLSLGLGAALGSFAFGPVAGALALRQRLPDWLARHAFRIHWYASVLFMFSLGYLAASVRHRAYDSFAALALLSLIVAGHIKTVLHIALRPTDDPETARGPDPPPP